MRIQLIRILSVMLFVGACFSAAAESSGEIKSFSPLGNISDARQVRVQFSVPMVNFGDIRDHSLPFEISCPYNGQSKWVDQNNWAFEFEEVLPRGVKCIFRPKEGLKSLNGNVIRSEKAYSFWTNGATIYDAIPPNGHDEISMDQVFVLMLDTDADPKSVEKKSVFRYRGHRKPSWR